MNQVPAEWLREFDAAMRRFYLIDHEMAGMEEADLLLYADLPPEEAALGYGEDYDLQRMDTDWQTPIKA